MMHNLVSTQFRRSAIGLVVLGSLLSFALGQHVGHGHTETLNVAHTQSAPVVSAHASGAIGTAVAMQPRKPATQAPLSTSTGVTYQGEHTAQKHGHGHGKGDSLVTLVTTLQSLGNAYSSHQDGGDSD